jgi:hypothetical protein
MELAIMTRALKCADYATLQDSEREEQQKRKVIVNIRSVDCTSNSTATA